jgi:hypothetical protein
MEQMHDGVLSDPYFPKIGCKLQLLRRHDRLFFKIRLRVTCGFFRILM